MGREVKRVAMDFEWPINKVWYGYLVGGCSNDCDSCRAYAKIKGFEMTNYNCPIIPDLEPPSGTGWQMWENVSEGSPVSPVMGTKEELAKWMVDNDTSLMSSATYEDWLAMIDVGYCVSGVVMNGKCINGVSACNK